MGKRGTRAHDLSGHVFGRLTVTSTMELRARRRTYWLCICTCGETKWVISDALKSGGTRSCGCLNDEVRREVVHGCDRATEQSPEYIAWHSMKQRCLNPTNDRYHRYGGRGIKICRAWIDDFRAFLSDMGRRPSGTTIERRDNDGGYCKDNCKWATNHEQSRNTSRNRMISFRDETLCVEDWRRRLGMSHATIHYRLNNWPIERALTEPVDPELSLRRRLARPPSSSETPLPR